MILLKGEVHDRSTNFLKPTREKKDIPTHARKMGIKKVSDKRKIENKIYENEKEKWRKERQAIDGFRCEFVGPEGGIRCKRKADSNPHHKRRRGKYLSEPSFFMAVCREHHDWIEHNGKAAVALGYLIR